MSYAVKSESCKASRDAKNCKVKGGSAASLSACLIFNDFNRKKLRFAKKVGSGAVSEDFS